MKLFSVKLALILGGLLAILYFSSDFALIDIEKTAIVVAIGVDEGKNKNYKITAQIAIPQATDAAAENDDAVITAEGDTVMEGIQNVGAKTGWHPKLSFCSLILVGRKTAERGIKDVVDYFLLSEKVQNSAVIAMADERADDILLSKTPLDAISSFAVSKIVLKSQWMTNSVATANLRKIAIGEYSASKASYMPVIKSIEEEGKSKEGGSSAVQASSEGSGGGGGGNSGGGGSSGSSESADEGNKVFKASTLAIFKNFKLCGEFNEELTQAFNLIKSREEEAYVSTENGNEKLLLSLSDNRSSISVSLSPRPTVKIRLGFFAEISDSTNGYPLDALNRRSILSVQTLDSANKKLNEVLNELVRSIVQADADVLGVKDYIYKHLPSAYSSLSSSPLSIFDYDVYGEVKSLD